MRCVTLTSCVAIMLWAGADGQYYNSVGANKVRDRMKLISGGGTPNPTRTPAPAPFASPYMEIQYSDPKLDGPYEANPKWDPHGMGQLYDVTRYFLGLVLPKQAYPESKLF